MESSPFIGRTTELDILYKLKDPSSRSTITAVYGRRRIGKTRLVMEAFRENPPLHFEGIEGTGSTDQKKHFLKTLYRHSGREAHRLAATSDWVDLLILLAEYVAEKPGVIFFDEFQWMAAGRNELVGKLKYVWDNYFSKTRGVHLILCGSVPSFLVNKVIRSRALYGRIEQIIHLRPLEFREALTGFFRNRSLREALDYYLVMGGIPKYLEMFNPDRSTMLNLERLCFKPGAYFHDEFERLFGSHFGKVLHYRTIVEYLSGSGFRTRKEIANHAGLSSGGRISGFLENLVLAGFVEACDSIHNPRATTLKRYRIADPFLRFYFRFIRPIGSRINRADGVPLHQALPENRFQIYLGLAFESFCFQHAPLIAARLGFSAVIHDYGPWFKRSDNSAGAQVDLVFRRADKVITVCEVKYRRRVTRDVIEEVDAKIDALRIPDSLTVEKVLISVLPPAREVYDSRYFSAILTADDLATGL